MTDERTAASTSASGCACQQVPCAHTRNLDGGVAESNAPVAPGEVQGSRPAASVESSAVDGVLRMESERRALIESTATYCIRCQVPYGFGSCTHKPPTADSLLRAVFQIGYEEERKQRIRNAQHALRYRREASPLTTERGLQVAANREPTAASTCDRERRRREKLQVALRDILLIESGRNIRYTRRLSDKEMWQAMTDIARTALEADRA
jgi:hypothetical protein